MGRLEGRSAVITGAASGIGEGIAIRFAEEGAKVVVADVDTAGGRRVAKAVEGTFVACDVSVEADLAATVERAVELHGTLDCFVGNAGLGGVEGPITDLDEAGFDFTVGVLLKGVAFGMKHACRAMQASGEGGSVISTSSVAGLMGGLGPHIYSACKAGVIGLTRSVAHEQGRFGIRVNCINPGGIATPIYTRHLGDDRAAAEEIIEQISTMVAEVTPLGRMGVPADIAGAAVWLASDDSSYVTGQTIVVDGGLIGSRLRRAQMPGEVGAPAPEGVAGPVTGAVQP
jgi:NAD(P)-dependent dehydrogenase (short-subunit alcohol dehydrogenase family)